MSDLSASRVRTSGVVLAALGVAFLAGGLPARADVSLVEQHEAATAQNQAKKAAKQARQAKKSGAPSLNAKDSAAATGSQSLIDSGGLKYFINTNITFSTSSSASGAMSEASYTHAVPATTLNGGVVNSTLNDAFDGYNGLFVSLTGVTGPCSTGQPGCTAYLRNGTTTSDCGGRQIIFNAQPIGGGPSATPTPGPTPPPAARGTSFSPSAVATGITVQRKVYVPANDQFARWLEIIQNTGATTQTVNLILSNNLGSDANTRVVANSTGTLPVTVNDTWVTTFQAYSGTTSSDPRLGHVMRGAGAGAIAAVNFADGDDNPWWSYSVVVPPGQKKVVMHFVTGQPSKAAAAAKAAAIAAAPPAIYQCMAVDEIPNVVNFPVAADDKPIPAAGTTGLLALAVGVAVGGALLLRRVG